MILYCSQQFQTQRGRPMTLFKRLALVCRCERLFNPSTVSLSEDKKQILLEGTCPDCGFQTSSFLICEKEERIAVHEIKKKKKTVRFHRQNSSTKLDIAVRRPGSH